ncbi:MAG TPA: hypothetical protein VE863_01435, partial [Pyrinomonadaceae bacterium]|nr:hypothetical protein [Pyrinomonadaceae bacterium]
FTFRNERLSSATRVPLHGEERRTKEGVFGDNPLSSTFVDAGLNIRGEKSRNGCGKWLMCQPEERVVIVPGDRIDLTASGSGR